MPSDEDPLGLVQENSFFPRKIAILYSDDRREYFRTEEEYLTEAGSREYAEHVAVYVRKLGIESEVFVGNETLAEKLAKYEPSMAFNLVDTVRGEPALAPAVPGLLELLHIPYTGTGIFGLSLSANKYVMCQLMRTNGIPVPSHQLFTTASDMIDPALRYPLFPKLNSEHSSVGVAENNVCENERELRAKMKEMFEMYRQPILVDEFISGKELTISILDGVNKKVYAVERYSGDDSEHNIVTFDKKWVNFLDMSYSKFEDDDLRDYTKEAFDVLKMSDYARFDVRMDGAGRYYFIDPNPNPYFGPPKETHASYTIVLDMYGVEFKEVLKRMIQNTARDAKITSSLWG